MADNFSQNVKFTNSLYNSNEMNENQDKKLDLEVFSNPLFNVTTDVKNENYMISINLKDFNLKHTSLSVSLSYKIDDQSDVKVLSLNKTNSVNMSENNVQKNLKINEFVPSILNVKREPLSDISTNVESNSRLNEIKKEFDESNHEFFKMESLAGSLVRKRKLNTNKNSDLICLNSDNSSENDENFSYKNYSSNKKNKKKRVGRVKREAIPHIMVNAYDENKNQVGIAAKYTEGMSSILSNSSTLLTPKKEKLIVDSDDSDDSLPDIKISPKKKSQKFY